ncbi:MAG: ATP-binding protein [Leptospirales bacterium]
MDESSKDKSPFYPGQPVPVELFTGRQEVIERILTRGAGQVVQGKPMSFFIQGEYGIGKSSLASYLQNIVEKEYSLHSIYVSLSGVHDLQGVSEAILQATVRSGAFDPRISEKINSWLSRYIGKQQLFGLTLNLEALKKDNPSITSYLGILDFLRETLMKMGDLGTKGLFLIFDEINGIASQPEFASFLKGLVDQNALSKKPLPILLMLCGTEDRRAELIKSSEPLGRIFDVITISPLKENEMENFFNKAFHSVHMTVEKEALSTLTYYSAGFPKIMHLVGDMAYWIDKDRIIDMKDTRDAVIAAAEDFGKKYVNAQIYDALKSEDYRSILAKIGKEGPDRLSFKKSDIGSLLTEQEKNKFHNFLQKMKRLNVLHSGNERGEYVFNLRMVRLYIWLQATIESKGR